MSLWPPFAWITLDTLCQPHWTQWQRLCFISRVSVFIITLLITRNCDWILPPFSSSFWLRLFRVLLLCFGLLWKNLHQILLGVWSVSYPGALDWQLGFLHSRFPPGIHHLHLGVTAHRAAPSSLTLLWACPGLWWSTNFKWLHCCGLWAKLPHSKVELQLNSLLKPSSSLDLWTLFRATSIIAYVYKLFRNIGFFKRLC